MAVAIPRRRFSVKDYYKLAKAGILRPDERVELLDGEIVPMSPIGPRHAHVVDCASAALWRAVGDRAIVRVQNPVRLSEHSEPEPDIALLRPRPEGYADAHPGPGETLLVIEVVDTTELVDRRLKLPLYARASVPEVWFLNLRGIRRRSGGKPVLEVHRKPGPDGYQETLLLRAGDRVSPLALPDVELRVEDLLGELSPSKSGAR